MTSHGLFFSIFKKSSTEPAKKTIQSIMFFLSGPVCTNGFFCSKMCVCFRCVCPEGFEGDACEINIDDCEDNDCENNSTCVDGINNYTCMCSPEYTGNKHQAEEQPMSACFLPYHILISLVSL